jgi:glucose-6-phosphate-specific signal transduction histidine kinase
VQEFDATRKKLEVKEVELRVLEEKLNERERVSLYRILFFLVFSYDDMF